MPADDRHFLDGPWAKIVALVIAAGCVAALVAIHRDDLFARPEAAEDTASLNPEFVACRKERTGQVEKMRADGLINETQFNTFTERAVAFCTSQFPPDEKPTPQ